MAKRVITKKKLIIGFASGRPMTVVWVVGEATFEEKDTMLILKRPEGRMTFYVKMIDYWVIETFKEEIKPQSREKLNSGVDEDSVFVDDH